MQHPEWRLPGPSRFTRTIAADLEGGRSAVVVLPVEGVPDGLRASVRDMLPDIEANRLSLSVLAGGRRRVVDSLYEVLDLSRPGPNERIHVGSFSGHPELERRLIWVDCRDASPRQVEAWGAFLRQYAGAAAGVEVHHRTVFATFCHGHQASAMPDTDRLVAKRWWWGVVGPLDTEVFVAEMLRERDRQPAFAETVAEVAGFDLGVASMLVNDWDGALDSLRSLLEGCGIRSPAPPLGWSPEPSLTPHPPAESVAAWDAGLVNSWGEHDPHLHPSHACVIDPSSLQHLIWRGQVRSMLPRIEIERQALARWVYERRDRLPPGWQRKDLMSLEVGDLAGLFSNVAELQRDRNRADRAQWLRRARNRIAHLKTLDRTDLEHARRIFPGGLGSK